MRKRLIIVAGIVLLSAVAYATASLNARPEPAQKTSTFDEIDQFKKSLVSEFKHSPDSFSVVASAQKLGAFRVTGGFAICSDKAEIEAKQYVVFSAFMDKFAPYPQLTRDLTALLDSDMGVTDCQFRVTEVIAKNAQAN